MWYTQYKFNSANVDWNHKKEGLVTAKVGAVV